uniref:hypothetical protein n=1 Tax=uncultured Sphingomonas sp. TaxID=158754 RepID=UPI0025E4151E|nr:hypothetical protein [uncultured Sphingomonas sp.]
MNNDDIEYHRARASYELNLGLTSNSMAAARSHLKLSSLHMERLRLLAGNNSERPPFTVA